MFLTENYKWRIMFTSYWKLYHRLIFLSKPPCIISMPPSTLPSPSLYFLPYSLSSHTDLSVPPGTLQANTFNKAPLPGTLHSDTGTVHPPLPSNLCRRTPCSMAPASPEPLPSTWDLPSSSALFIRLPDSSLPQHFTTALLFNVRD